MTLESLSQFGSSLLMCAGESAVRSIALALTAGLVLSNLRVKQSGLRLLSWTGVLYAAMLMPLLGLILPSINVRLLPAQQQAILPPPVAAASTGPRNFGILDLDESHATASATTGASAVTLLATSAAPDRGLVTEDTAVAKTRGRSSAAITSKVLPWALALLGYLAVVAVFLGRIIVGFVLSRRLRRLARRIADPETVRLPNQGSFLPIRSGQVELAESSMVSVPVAIGVFHPTILLPSDWREWDSPKLSAVLAHELSHVARRDALTQLVSAIHRSIFWFSPLPWWLHPRLIDLAEQASDDSALLVIQDPAVYAEVLLGFFQTLNAAPARWLGVSMARGDRARRRIERMLSGSLPAPARLKGKSIAALAVLAVALTVPASSIRIGRAATDQDKQSKTASPASKGRRPARSAASTASDSAEGQIEQRGEVPASAGPSSGTAANEDSIGAAPVTAEETGQQAVPAPASALSAPVVAVPATASPATPGAPAILAAVGPVMAIPATSVLVAPKSFAPIAPLAAITAAAPVIAQDREVWADDRSESFAIVKSNGSTHFSGSWKHGDGERIKELRSKIKGDFIWFRHEGRSYIITDPATVKAAEELLAPQEDFGLRQADLAKQEAALAERQAELGRHIAGAKVEMPDLSTEIQKLTERVKEVERLKEATTQQRLSELQAVLSELQSRVAVAESQASHEQAKIAEMLSEMGRRHAELGRQQSLLGEELARRAREDSKKVRQLLERALSDGLAKPEP